MLQHTEYVDYSVKNAETQEDTRMKTLHIVTHAGSIVNGETVEAFDNLEETNAFLNEDGETTSERTLGKDRLVAADC